MQDKRSDFLIPDYQRPYAWGEEECATLWDDLYSFAIPDNDFNRFKDDDEYFLGPIVTFKNSDGKQEVIDGQQRLTTIMLLLRAFYKRFEESTDDKSLSTRENIEKCIWKTDEFGKPLKDKLKIDSAVATDDDKDEFLEILQKGEINQNMNGQYAKNFQFFEDRINEYCNTAISAIPYLPTRIMNNCILLPIEAESQDTALMIFSTLNDRGKPLSDADIFKAQFYKYYSQQNRKDEFIGIWKKLEEEISAIFGNVSGNPMDELFTRYMYYERALEGNKSTTTGSLRKFFERDGYKLLKNDHALKELQDLCAFWGCISRQDRDVFDDRVLNDLYKLNYSPNVMWTYITSVYYLANKRSDGTLDNGPFAEFLEKINAFILGYSIDTPGMNNLRTPIYSEMLKVVKKEPVTFEEFRMNEEKLRSKIETYEFTNGRPITKSYLTWWEFENADQKLIELDKVMQIEHIYSVNRFKKEGGLASTDVLECLGNKAMLERRINIRAADYRFSDKKPYYLGNPRTKKEGTADAELRKLTDNSDFTEDDIRRRNSEIIDGIIGFMREEGVLEEGQSAQ